MQKQEKIHKSDTFSGGGGGETRFYGQNDFMDIWAFLILGLAAFLLTDPEERARDVLYSLPVSGPPPPNFAKSGQLSLEL